MVILLEDCCSHYSQTKARCSPKGVMNEEGHTAWKTAAVIYMQVVFSTLFFMNLHCVFLALREWYFVLSLLCRLYKLPELPNGSQTTEEQLYEECSHFTQWGVAHTGL